MSRHHHDNTGAALLVAQQYRDADGYALESRDRSKLKAEWDAMACELLGPSGDVRPRLYYAVQGFWELDDAEVPCITQRNPSSECHVVTLRHRESKEAADAFRFLWRKRDEELLQFAGQYGLLFNPAPVGLPEPLVLWRSESFQFDQAERVLQVLANPRKHTFLGHLKPNWEDRIRLSVLSQLMDERLAPLLRGFHEYSVWAQSDPIDDPDAKGQSFWREQVAILLANKRHYYQALFYPERGGLAIISSCLLGTLYYRLMAEFIAPHPARFCLNPDCRKAELGGRELLRGSPKQKFCSPSCRTHAGYLVHGEAYRESRRARYRRKKQT